MFCTLEKVIFYQEHCQTLFLINLAEKGEGKGTSNVWTKSCANYLQKMQTFQVSNINLFVGYEGFFVSRTSLNTLFEQFEPKKRSEETSNF